MPQEYTVKQWKPWENEEGLIRDNFGNYKGTVIFDEDASEPIDATFKTQPNPGDKKYGTVGEYTTKAGKIRKGFKSASKPEQVTFAAGPATKDWANNNDHIAAQWALGRAYEKNGKGQQALEDARWLFENLSNVTSPKADAPSLATKVDEERARRELEQDAERLRNTFKTDEVYQPQDDPINLDDIPF